MLQFKSFALVSLCLVSLSTAVIAQSPALPELFELSELPELSGEEARQPSVLLGNRDADRQQVAVQLAVDPPIPIIAHLCFQASQAENRGAALQSLKLLNAEYGTAVEALVRGAAPDKRLAAMQTLRDFGYRGKFASPAVRIEAQRGRQRLEANNGSGWRQLDSSLRNEINCYKVALWLLGQYEASEAACDFLLDQVEFPIASSEPGRVAEIEALLFAEGEQSLFNDPSRSEWYAGAFTAVGMLAAANLPLRPMIVERLRQQLHGTSAIRKIQGARTLTTCAGVAAPALDELTALARNDADPRVREAAGKAAEMIQARVEAAQLLGDGSDLQVLFNMLATGDESAARAEALEWIVNRQPGLYRFANAMFRNAVPLGHYRQLQEALQPPALRAVNLELLSMMLDFHTQHLLRVNAWVRGEAEDDSTLRLQESSTIVSRMELLEHQLQLLATIFEFTQPFSQLTTLLEQYHTAETAADCEMVSQSIVRMYLDESHPAVREKMLQLVLARGRRALMQHTLNEESQRDDIVRRQTLGELAKHLELLQAWSEGEPKVTTLLCDELFGDLHLLYLGGPGNDGGHLFAPALVELYITALVKFGEYPKQRAVEFEGRSQAWANDPQYSRQVRGQIARYDSEVMSRLRRDPEK